MNSVPNTPAPRHNFKMKTHTHIIIKLKSKADYIVRIKNKQKLERLSGYNKSSPPHWIQVSIIITWTK